MEAPKNRWQGKRAIIVVRQSNDKDGTASTAAQLDFMVKELEKVGMRYVDNVAMEGVPGSAPARMSEVLEGLVARKKMSDDFDVIAWQVEDRASRGGGDHGMWQEHEAKRNGILFFFAGDDQPTGPFAAVGRVAKYEAAKDMSFGNGRRTAQGQAWAQKQGFFRTSGQTPMGCDRIYYGSDDRPKFLLHNLANGLQEQRDYATGTVIGTYGTVGPKSYNRFRKQRNEYSLLCPGNREQQKVVRVIFYLRYKRGWRGLKIAGFLNRIGVLSPKGKEWSQRQAQIIYENEAYTGVTFNNQTFSGRYFRRDRVYGFVALDRDECELVVKKTFVPKVRPIDEWERIDQPHMYDFLPRDVRDLAVAAQAEIAEQRADPGRRAFKPSAHPASEYLLSGKLRAVQDDGVLIGTLSGPTLKKTPYYRHRRSKRGHRKGSVFNNLIPARPLHAAITAMLAQVLIDTPDLKDRLTRHLTEQRARTLQDQPDVTQLEAEREELKQRILTLLRVLSGPALAEAEPELKRLGDRRNACEAQLDAVTKDQGSDLRPVDAVVADALRILAVESQTLLTLPIEPLRNLVDCIIAEATVDLETKAVEFKLNLPTWAVQKQLTPRKKQKSDQKRGLEGNHGVCPPASSWSSNGSWTQQPWMTIHCDCIYTRGSTKQPVCYDCRRMRSAA